MVRDKLKSEEYFKEFIEHQNERILSFEKNIENGTTAKTAIPRVRYLQYTLKFDIICAKYCLGASIEEIKEDFNVLLDIWINGYLMDPVANDNTYGPYSRNIMLISLCVLLDVDNLKIEAVKERLKKEKINDWVFNFLLYNKNMKPEEIEGKLYWPKDYGELKELVFSDDIKRKEAFEIFVTKKWYRKQRSCNWWGSHKQDDSKYLYYGYWAFETAAFAKILNIDDSLLKNFKYYPYDLVHPNKT